MNVESKVLFSGWGHPPKGKAQHYFVPDRGTLYHDPDKVVVSLCGAWRLDSTLWWRPVALQSQPLSTADGEYYQYPLCKKCVARAGSRV